MEEEYGELDAHIDQVINQSLSNIAKFDIGLSTCQLLRHDPLKDLMLPFASGVFIEVADEYFMLTASHVVEDWSNENKLFVKVNESYVSLVGKACGTVIEKEQRIDCAYIRLKPEIVPILDSVYRFLPPEKCLHPAQMVHEATYCVLGYPVALGNRAMSYFTHAAPDKVFEHYGLHPLQHYVMLYEGKGINIQSGAHEKFKIEHYGLSGCGLWYINLDINEGDMRMIGEARLLGIMTEFRTGKFQCLIANRLEIVIASIRHNEGI